MCGVSTQNSDKTIMKNATLKLTILIAMQVLYNLSTTAQYTKLLDFAGSTNGAYPYASLISDGTFLYGTTEKGGTYNLGTIFKIMPDGSGYKKLHDFTGGSLDGHTPRGSLLYDGTSMWGMTSAGGSHADGIIFNLLPNGSGYKNIYDFLGATSGRVAKGNLISDGTYLYGMTSDGGAYDNGTIFKLLLNGTGFTKIFDFDATKNGRWPDGSLVYDGTFLYGMTGSGGIKDLGIMFKIMPDGSGFTKLLDFDGTTTGGNPHGSLISDHIYMYGMTSVGGAYGNGTIFKISPNGNGYMTLLNFDGKDNGRGPQGSLIFDNGYLYGMTKVGGVDDIGTVFRIGSDGNGYQKLMDFKGSSNGREPWCTLYSDGNFLYGMTWKGGTSDLGVIFKNTIVTSINEYSHHELMTISPNPASDFVTFNFTRNVNDAIKLSIYNISGELIWFESLQQDMVRVNTGSMKNGIYLIEAIFSDFTGKQKLIIQR
jgi:uncharacterized repeat protein (TIGR03803 family)